MKICVLILFLMLPWIARIGDWALGWTDGNEKLQIVFVMMLFPLIMNAMQYYIIDSFIMAKSTDHERLPQEDSDDETFDDTLVGNGLLDSDEEAVQPAKQKTYKGMKTKDTKAAAEEYDPERDHEVGRSDSGQDQQGKKVGKVLPEELVPHE